MRAPERRYSASTSAAPARRISVCTSMPRRLSTPIQSWVRSPSSKPVISASLLVAPQTTRWTPDHGIAPRHIAQGSHEVASSIGAPCASARFQVDSAAWARLSATISACALEQASGSTRLTPMAIRRPSATELTTAPNGPPVPAATLRRERSMASRIRSAGVDNRSGSSAARRCAQSGNSMVNACEAFMPGASCFFALPERFEQRDAGGDRHVEALGAAAHGNPGERVAALARELPQPLFLAAHDQRQRTVEVGGIKAFVGLAGQSDAPYARFLQALHRARQVGYFDERYDVGGAGGRPTHGRCHAGGAVARDDHGIGAGGGRRAQACAQVVRILDLVEQHQQGAGSRLFDDIDQIGFLQRLQGPEFRHYPLVILAFGQLVEGRRLGLLNGNAVAGGALQQRLNPRAAAGGPDLDHALGLVAQQGVDRVDPAGALALHDCPPLPLLFLPPLPRRLPRPDFFDGLRRPPARSVEPSPSASPAIRKSILRSSTLTDMTSTVTGLARR